MNKFLFIFLYLIFNLSVNINNSNAESIFYYQNKYTFNPLNLELEFEQKEKSIKIFNSDKYGVLQIPNDYYLVFEAKKRKNIDLDFVLKHEEMNKYFYATTNKELTHKKKINSQFIKQVQKKKKILSLNQNQQLLNIHFLLDRFRLTNSDSFFEVYNKVGKEEFYCYKFFFRNMELDRTSIKQFVLTPTTEVFKILISFKIGKTVYQSLLLPNIKNEFLFNLASQPKFDTWKKIEILSIKYFSQNRIMMTDNNKITSHYGKENIRYNIDILHEDQDTVFFSIPISSNVLKLKKQEITLSDKININDIFITSLSRIKVLNKATSYKINKKNRIFLEKKYKHDFYLNKHRKEFRDLKDLNFKFTKNHTYYIKFNYGNTFKKNTQLKIDFQDIRNNRNIHIIKPNSFYKLKFKENLKLKNINIIDSNNLELKFLDSFEIFKENFYSSYINNISVFDFPILIKFNEKKLNFESTIIGNSFNELYDQNNLIYNYRIKNKNNKKFKFSLNQFFLNNNKEFKIEKFFLNIENNQKNVNSLLKKFQNECYIKLEIIFEDNSHKQCINKSRLTIDLLKFDNYKIISINLLIDNEKDIFKKNIILSGINVFRENLNIDKPLFVDMFKTTFKNKIVARKFLKNYFYIHPANLNIDLLLKY